MPPPQPQQRTAVVTASGPIPDAPPLGYQPWLRVLLQEQEFQYLRHRELWPVPRAPVVTASGPLPNGRMFIDSETGDIWMRLNATSIYIIKVT
jgi:hypothetical protein